MLYEYAASPETSRKLCRPVRAGSSSHMLNQTPLGLQRAPSSTPAPGTPLSLGGCTPALRRTYTGRGSCMTRTARTGEDRPLSPLFLSLDATCPSSPHRPTILLASVKLASTAVSSAMSPPSGPDTSPAGSLPPAVVACETCPGRRSQAAAGPGSLLLEELGVALTRFLFLVVPEGDKGGTTRTRAGSNAYAGPKWRPQAAPLRSPYPTTAPLEGQAA